MDLMVVVPIIMLCIYVGIVLFIGVVIPFLNRRKHSTFEEFYTGSKSMPAFVVGMLILVTFYSGSTFTGKLGFVVKYGVVGAYTMPYTVMSGLALYLLAEKVWPLGKKYRLSTLADLMELRYQDKKIKLLTGITGICMNIPWLTMEVITMGMTLNIATNGYLPIPIGSALAMSIIIFYLVKGGVKSVSLVDTFSAILMLIGSCIVFVYIINYFYNGDVSTIWTAVDQVSKDKLILPDNLEIGQWQFWLSWTICGTLGMLAWPSNYMEIYLGKSVKETRKSGIITAFGGMFNLVYIILGFAAVGIVALGYPAASDPQFSLLEMVKLTGNPFIFGLLACFMFALTLGTMDSTLLALSGLFSNDVVTTIKRIKENDENIGEVPGEEAQLRRVTSSGKDDVKRVQKILIGIGIIAYGIGLLELPMMVFIAGYVYEGIIQLIPLVLGGLYWRKSTKQGAYAGFASGMLLFIGMNIIGFKPFGGIFPGIVAVLVNTIVFVVVSSITYEKYKEENEKKYGHIYHDFYEGDALKGHFTNEEAAE